MNQKENFDSDFYSNKNDDTKRTVTGKVYFMDNSFLYFYGSRRTYSEPTIGMIYTIEPFMVFMNMGKLVTNVKTGCEKFNDKWVGIMNNKHIVKSVEVFDKDIIMEHSEIIEKQKECTNEKI